MRLGIVARTEAGRGLANQTWEACKHLDPDRVLLVDPGRDGRFTQHPERYEQWETTTARWNGGKLDENAVRPWLDGLDCVYCADEETEILSRRGWLRYDELTTDDEVLTLTTDHLSEWQPVLAVNVFEARPRRMLSVESRGHSSLTTEDHWWPVLHEISGGVPYRYRLDKDFVRSSKLGRRDRIPRAAPCINLPTEPKYGDALVELVAWFYTEGCIRRRSDGSLSSLLQLCQSHRVNPDNCARIRACLNAVFGPPVERFTRNGGRRSGTPMWRERVGDRNVEWHLNSDAGEVVLGHAPGKVVGLEFVQSLTRAQLELFFNVSMLADNNGPRAFAQKEEARLNAFELACVLLGRGVSRRHEKSGMHTTSLYKSMYMHVSMGRREWVEHDGIVWCPTTPNGTWFARRRDTMYFTGNSAETPYDLRLPQWAAEAGCGVVVQANPEFLGPIDARAAVTWWVATPWRMEHLPARTRVVPMPVPDAPYAERCWDPTEAERENLRMEWGRLRFGHTAGWPAIQDRNGTETFAAAAGLTTVGAEFVIRGQHPDVKRFARNGLRVEAGCLDDHWDLYRGIDVLVMPRRFGGLCLPVLEALAVGIPVVMPDCSPNELWPGPRVPATSTATVGTRAGPLPLHDVDPQALAATLDELAANPGLVDKLHAEAADWVAGNTWEALKPMWLEELARACW